MRPFLSIIFILYVYSANAERIQILHTNDVHSYFQHAVHNPDVGGYARLRALMDKYEARGNEEGITTIRVDAGDFMEGNLLYMADSGRKSFQIQNLMDYDVITIGNHDYLMGTDELEGLLSDVPANFAFLGANFWARPSYKEINRQITPFHEIEVAGKKIAFLGLTTNEIFFKWRVYNGGVEDPYRTGRKWARILKDRGNDLVIGLTHLGLRADRKLIRKSSHIDLVIGGHSHDFLHEPVYQRNSKFKKVPIVQAGSHGEVFGRLVIDVKGSDDFEIISYELVPVEGEEKDPLIDKFVNNAIDDINEQYGVDWLYKVVGHSHLYGKKGHKIWNCYITDSVMESIGADISVHTPSMSGPNFPRGSINRYALLDGHPRFFEMKDKRGWKIYRAQIRGGLLRTFFKLTMNFRLPLYISGISFKWRKTVFGKTVIHKLRINGEKVNPFKKYEIALPEGIMRGARSLFPFLASILFKNGHQTKKTMIEAMEEKLQREGEVSMDYLEEYDERVSSFYPFTNRMPRTFYFPHGP